MAPPDFDADGIEDTAPFEPPGSDTGQMAKLRASTKAKLFGTEAEPTSIGRYTVVEKLGAGGMGVVYLAHDGDLDRRVAVKVLRPDAHEGTAGRARLLREAQAMAKLSHRHVVHVYEVGRQDDLVFIAMQYVAGVNLREWSDAERSVAETLDVYRRAGEGLAAAHAAGLVHRDFKPENVIVSDEGDVRVLDFGLARPEGQTAAELKGPPTQESEASPVDNLTETGTLIGTPAYMAPEQLAGVVADARADQFAFCVSLFEALFRRRPFGGATMAELTCNVRDGKIVDVDPAERAVPVAIHRALVRGLATRPDDRFGTMEELLAALSLSPSRRRTWWVALPLAGAIVAAAVWLQPKPAADEPDTTPPSPFAAVLDRSALPPLIPKPLPGDLYGVTVHRLDNGLTVYISEDHDAPLLAAAVAIRAGGSHETAGATGVAHMLEHLLYKGTAKFGTLDYEAEEPLLARRDELARALENEADADRRAEILGEVEAVEQAAGKLVPQGEYGTVLAALGGDFNGITNDRMTLFYVHLPSANFDAWAALQAECVQHPVFRGMFAEMGSVFEEYRLRVSGNGLLETMTKRALFAGTSLDHNVMGKLEDIQRPPFSAMRKFHAERYVPNNVAIVLVGDIDADRALPALERVFGGWEPRDVEQAPPIPEPLPPGRSEHEGPKTFPVAAVLAWRNAVRSPGADQRRVLAHQVITAELWQAFEGSSVVALASIGTAAETTYAALEPAQGASVEDAEKALFSELRALRERGPEEDTLRSIEAQHALERVADARSPGHRMMRIATSYAMGWTWADTVASALAEAPLDTAVTAELDRLLGEGYVVLKRTDTPGEATELRGPTIGPVEHAPQGRSAFAQEILDLPAASLEPQFVLEGRHYTSENDGVSATVDDGLTSMRIEYPFGVLDDPLACFAMNTWGESGTDGLTRTELRDRLGRLGVDVSFMCDLATTTIQIRLLDENVAAAWPLVREWLRAPVPGVDGPERGRAEWLASTRMQRQTDAVVEAALRDFATYGQRSFYRSAAPRSRIERVSLEDVRRTLSAIRARRPVVTYAGGQDRPELPALPAQSQVHGGLKAQKFERPQVFAMEDKAREHVRISIDFVRGPLEPADRLAADALVTYYAGTMSGLLFYELRTSRSLAYVANGELTGGGGASDDSILRLNIVAGGDRVQEAIGVALEAIQAPIDADRFARVRDALEAKYRGRRIEPSLIPDRVAQWRRAGLERDPLLSTWPSLASFTVEELDAFRKTYAPSPPVITVLGNLDELALEELGEVHRVTVDDIFAAETD